ncbi:hypothetical protein ACU5CE_09935 [Priestia megaterium]|uniref:hypothetical protein n=1 Tax=Priestia megaterium TaxID=1404 RepID=UPI00406BA36B
MTQYFPLIGAFIGAVIAQVLSHVFSIVRENNTYNKKVYQEFIYPFVTDVVLFYKTETNFRKGHDVEKEIDLEKLIEDMSEKISYGNMKLMSAIYHYQSSSHFFDGRGGTQERERLKVFFWYLDYTVYILNKLPKKDNEMIEEIINVQKHYAIWYLVFEKLDVYEETVEFMQYDFYFPKWYMDKLSIDELRMVIEENREQFQETLQDFLVGFMNVINTELRTSSDSTFNKEHAFSKLHEELKSYRKFN